MSKTSKIILVTIIATCILLGLGYAAITNITLNIAGSASASADQANFKVRFVGTPVVSDSVAASAKITADHTATISVQGLTTAGQFVTATYEIKNESQDLSGDLKVETTNSNKEYFTISSKLDKSSLKSGESTTALVTVKLTKTPIDGDVSSNIGVTLTAMPVEPGKEGTSEGTNDFSSSPINRPVNEYGFYYGEAYTQKQIGGVLDGMTTSMVFYEEGYCEVYSNEYVYAYRSAEQIEYSKNTITIDDGDASLIVSNNGYTITDGNAVYELNLGFMDKQIAYNGELNEYGFYYDVPYVVGLWGTTVGLKFHRDSTVSWFEDGIYTDKLNATYSFENIDLDGSEVPVYEDGKYIIRDGWAHKIKPDYKMYNYTYITKNVTTGKYIYSDKFPDTHKENDMYAVGSYLYTYKKGTRFDGWKVELLTDESILPNGMEVTNREKESYEEIPYRISGVQVIDATNLYAGCTNLVVTPEIAPGIENMSGMFDGCTSLTTAPTIYTSVTNVTNAFRGCTSLTGEITIDYDNITEYAGCFAGVDMSKITLTGDASNATKNKLGSTGLNYEMLPEDEVEE